MSRFLALDGDTPRLHLAAGTCKGGTVRLERALAWAEDRPVTLATAEAVGRRLRDKLKEAKVAPAPLLVAVGRDRVLLKEVRHPAVPAADEPALVRFQTLKEITDPADEVVIDYQPLPGAGPMGERRALAVVLRKEFVQAYRKLAEAAGLKLAGVTPRAAAVAAALDRAARTPGIAQAEPPGDGPVAVLARGDGWGEFTVTDAGALAFARSVPGPAFATENALRGELKRNLVGAASQVRGRIGAVYLTETAGGDPEQQSRLRESLGVPVRAFDPLAGLDDAPLGPRGGFAGVVGLLALASRGKDVLPVNFAAPREPRPEVNPNRTKLLAAAAAAAAVVVALGGFGAYKRVQKDRQIAELYATKTSLEEQLAKLDPDARRIKALEEWTGGEVVWLDELYDVTAHFPDPDRLRLTALIGEPLQRTAKGAKHVARMTLKGINSGDGRDVDKLINEFVAEGVYSVGPKEVRPNTGLDRRTFVQQFSTRLDLEKRPPEKYARYLDAKPQPRTRPEGGEAGFGGGAP